MKITFPTEYRMNSGTLAQLLGGTVCVPGTDRIPLSGLCTDSREADADTAFVALLGERTDGKRFLSSAVDTGCRCVVYAGTVAESLLPKTVARIAVADTEQALLHMAAVLCSKLPAKVVAVTGSVGKTTTKDLIGGVLSETFGTYVSSGNHNSLIGMPMSVAEIPPAAEWAVLEMGMSGFGEIEKMSDAAKPEIAVITNIGSAHMEMLGSRENICRAKLEILCGLRDGGHLIVNGDEPLLRHIGGKSYRTHEVSLLRDTAEFFAQNIRMDGDFTCFDAGCAGKRMKDVRLPVMGRHHVYNALFAIAVGTVAGVPEERIREGLLRYRSDGFRQKEMKIGDVTVIADCYNASPESMEAALEVLSQLRGQRGCRAIAVLGDMRELGQESAALHRAVGSAVARQKTDFLFTVGHDAEQIAVGAMQGGMPPECVFRNSDTEAPECTARAMATLLRSGDLVLVKASRAVRAERVINCLKEMMSGENPSVRGGNEK